MKLTKSTLLAKLNALIGCVALILFIVAFSTNFWLQKDFNFPANRAGIEFIPVQASIGIFTACSKESYPNNRTYELCSPDGAADWEYVCVGLTLVELVLGVIGAILAILAVVGQKLANNLKVKLAIVLCWFITCGFALGPLIIFPVNRKIQVRPNLSTFQVDFDLSWSYIVSAVSAVLYAVLVLLNTADIIWSDNCGEVEANKKGDRSALSQDYDNETWRC